MHAVKQMLAFLYHIVRSKTIEKSRIYEQFFESPFVKRFCEQEGIDEATLEASRRRCPFILNILAATGIIENERSSITVKRLILLPYLVKPYAGEDDGLTLKRFISVISAMPNDEAKLEDCDLSVVKELFGADFLTREYYLKDFDYEEI